MRYGIVLMLMLASLCFALQKKGKSPKPTDVVVLEVTCRRMDGDLSLDGRLQVQSEKPLKGLQLLFDFLGSDKQLLQTKRSEVESGTLQPGSETEFRLRVADHARAIYYVVRAVDKNEKDLSIERAGPFPIE